MDTTDSMAELVSAMEKFGANHSTAATALEDFSSRLARFTEHAKRGAWLEEMAEAEAHEVVPPNGTVLPTAALHVLHDSTEPLDRWPLFQLSSQSWLVPYVLDIMPEEDEGCGFVSIAGYPTDTEHDHLAFQMSENGASWFVDDLDASPIQQALEFGICPMQVFYLLVFVETWGGGMYGDEYDESWGMELLWKENVSEFEACRRWEELLASNAREWAIRQDHRDRWQAAVDAASRYLFVDYLPAWNELRWSLRTNAQQTCECHKWDIALHSGSKKCDEETWIEALASCCPQYSDKPLLMRRREAEFWLRHYQADGWHVELEDFELAYGQFWALPSMSTMDDAVKVIDARRRLDCDAEAE